MPPLFLLLDIAIDSGARVVPIEVKSSTTYRTDFHRGLNAFSRIVSIKGSALGAVVVNGASTAREVNGVIFANPLEADFTERVFG